jgi:hypothetical protein
MVRLGHAAFTETSQVQSPVSDNNDVNFSNDVITSNNDFTSNNVNTSNDVIIESPTTYVDAAESFA